MKKPAGKLLALKEFKIGMTGFEPATSRTPSEHATKLRYTPKDMFNGESIYIKVVS